MNKNEEFTTEIIDMTNEGEGVGKSDDGFTFFIHGGITGDVVKASVTKVKKTYGYARIVEIIMPSKDRVEPMCPVAGKCGGCSLLHMSYESELRFKENKIKAAIERIGGFEEGRFEFEPIIGFGDARPLHYRNKAQFPVGKDSDGNIVTGFYAGRSHRIIPVENCQTQHEVTGDILRCVKAYMKKNHVTAYDEVSGKGLVRHVMVRIGFATGEVGICLVINGNSVPAEGELIALIRETIENFSNQENVAQINGQSEAGESKQDNTERAAGKLRLTSLTLNINKEKTNVIMGRKLITLYGNDYITDEINGIKFHISPLSFYQVNHTGVQSLYGKALEFAKLSGKETVWDLYCGIGTISLFLARNAKRVYGVEIVPEAIENAKENAALNDISNVKFQVGAAEDIAPKLPKPDVIVVDPPRKGCDEKLLETILKYLPEKIVYVSCDPATLARDLKILCENKAYKLEKVRPVDMFSGSFHVETVVLLSQQKPDEHVRIKIDLDELDETSAETKATYEKIKAWVQDNYGFKVSTLDIAQVKRRNGIIERENYNKPKSENSVKRTVTPEKERAITDALKHFNMI